MAELHPLLTVQRVVVEPAPAAVLQSRLDERLRDKAWRLQRYASRKWPFSLSDQWLQNEIDVLESGIAASGAASPQTNEATER